MDPCPFVRVVVGNLAVKPAKAGVQPSSSPYYCKVRFKDFPVQSALLPMLPSDASDGAASGAGAATFDLSAAELARLGGKRAWVRVEVWAGRRGVAGGCWSGSGKLVGKVAVEVDLSTAAARSAVFHNGWAAVGEAAAVFVTVRADPDPRFVFEFEGEPKCSPQVFQIQGSLRQPVFTCNFSVRSSDDWTIPSRGTHQSLSKWRRRFKWLNNGGGGGGGGGVRERKGWSITVHDLSGARVATASMVTPFVPSPASSGRVSRANPGAWLILRPAGPGATLKPWGRLEAWLDRRRGGRIGYRFHLLYPDSDAAVVLTESAVSTSAGGKLSVDLPPAGPSPAGSPHGSGDFGRGLPRGFVMSSTVAGPGRPAVEVGMQHVGCREDAAAFVALAAAAELSVDACKPFSHKPGKEFCQNILGL